MFCCLIEKTLVFCFCLLVVVVGFLCVFVFVGLFLWLCFCFGLVFGVCLVVVVVVGYLGAAVADCSGCTRRKLEKWVHFFILNSRLLLSRFGRLFWQLRLNLLVRFL